MMKMLTIIAYITISGFALLYAIHHFFGNRDLCKRTSHIHGPITFPLIGCAYLFMGNASYILLQVTKLCYTYASPFRVIVGPKVAVIIQDPEQIKTVFLSSKTTEKNEFYDFGKAWAGNGLITAPRSIWRVHRKLIQPAFSTKILQSFISIFQKTSRLLTEEFSGKVGQPEFDVYPDVSFTSFRNICETSLGMPVTAKTKEIDRFLDASERVFEAIIIRGMNPLFHFDTIFNMTKISKTFYDAVEFLITFTLNVIEKRRIHLKSESFQNEGQDRKKPFLDLMLEMADNGLFTEDEIREHADTVIEAGYDTVGRTNCFTLLMLASHPDIQDKVYKELYEIYGSESPDETPVKLEDLKHMEYLERVIKEVMRLYPAVPLLGRKLLEDFPLDGCLLPKGCGIVTSIIALHRDKRYWTDPLKFNPDRFLPEGVEKLIPYTYMPFSLGPRDCIGRVYAMMSMKILMATLLRKYVLIKDKITPVEDIQLRFAVMLEPAKPITMRIEKRVK
ncbi:cytochrome P450 4C1-like isoform X2 [Belonocnema kinseyi]|uniref:cytochrome P450 4C1-like isoform X2 n=1 Tax=Belonocnema kinseyi TaxID=2817044 RepID=UPI00143D798F|nr:cytochrome P450 4C1-like isoform X2 [Belonocnema kinseyi]